MLDEHTLAIAPIVQDSIQHNARALSNIRAFASIVLGLCAGLLHLESLWGFGFYFLGNLLVSALVYVGPLGSTPEKYIFSQGGKDSFSLWSGVLLGGGVLGVESIMGFVMCWTIGYAVVEG